MIVLIKKVIFQTFQISNNVLLYKNICMQYTLYMLTKLILQPTSYIVVNKVQG